MMVSLACPKSVLRGKQGNKLHLSAQMEMSWPADATGDRRVCRLPTEMAAGALTM